MCDDRSSLPRARIDVPIWVLFNGDGWLCCERSVDAVVPPFAVGITVVGVHYGAGAGMEGLLGVGRNDNENGQNELPAGASDVHFGGFEQTQGPSANGRPQDDTVWEMVLVHRCCLICSCVR